MTSRCTPGQSLGLGVLERMSLNTFSFDHTWFSFTTSVPHGGLHLAGCIFPDFWPQKLGYVLGLILASTIDAQSKTPHPDVIHVTAHFLQSVDVSDYEVQVRRVRQGKKLSNLDAVLLQRVCIGSSLFTRLDYNFCYRARRRLPLD